MILKSALAALTAFSTVTSIANASSDGRMTASRFGKKLVMPNDITAESELGRRLLSHARRVEGDEDDKEEESGDENEEVEWDYSNFAWVSDYSLKFQGCHHMKQWNDEGDGGEGDVKVMTRRLVRFRLCEKSKCSDKNTDGCKKGYGDYVVDLSTFAQSYVEHKQIINQYQGDYDANEENFELDRYMECERLEIEEEENEGGEEDERDEGDRRRLEDKEEEEVEYFVGPYCAEKGGAIYLGLFTDDECSNFADDDGGKDTYYALTNSYLPYGSESLVDMNCMHCDNENYAYGNDNYVGDQCGQPYARAGKCEENLSSNVVGDQNNAACSYIEGIHIAREDGIVVAREQKASGVATFFIILFACTTFFFLYYVYLLRKKLGMKNILLS